MKIYALFFMLCYAPCVWGAEKLEPTKKYSISTTGGALTDKILSAFSSQYQIDAGKRFAGFLPVGLRITHTNDHHDITEWQVTEFSQPTNQSNNFYAKLISDSDQHKTKSTVHWAYTVDVNNPVKSLPASNLSEREQHKLELPNPRVSCKKAITCAHSDDLFEQDLMAVGAQVNLNGKNVEIVEDTNIKRRGIDQAWRRIAYAQKDLERPLPQKHWYSWHKQIEVFDLKEVKQKDFWQNHRDFGQKNTMAEIILDEPVPPSEINKKTIDKKTTFAKTVILSGLLATAAAAWKCYSFFTPQK